MYEMSVERILLLQFSCFMGSKGDAVLRALASHQCGPGSNPGVDARHMSVEFVVGSLPSPRGFLPGTPVCLLLKNQHFHVPIRPGIR